MTAGTSGRTAERTAQGVWGCNGYSDTGRSKYREFCHLWHTMLHQATSPLLLTLIWATVLLPAHSLKIDDSLIPSEWLASKSRPIPEPALLPIRPDLTTISGICDIMEHWTPHSAEARATLKLIGDVLARLCRKSQQDIRLRSTPMSKTTTKSSFLEELKSVMAQKETFNEDRRGYKVEKRDYEVAKRDYEVEKRDYEVEKRDFDVMWPTYLPLKLQKRRWGDTISACIQSHCSSFSGATRVGCIVQRCQRKRADINF